MHSPVSWNCSTLTNVKVLQVPVGPAQPKSVDCCTEGCHHYHDKTAGILSLIRGFSKWSLFSPHLINELLWFEKPGMHHTWKAKTSLGQQTEPTLLSVKCNYFFFSLTTMMNSEFSKLTLAVHVSPLWLFPICGAL